MRHVTAIEKLISQFSVLTSVYDLIAQTYVGHRNLYIAGNGGSAADAQHIAAELIGRFKVDRQALNAIALTTDTSCLTAIGNDYGFSDVFARQVEGVFRHGDLLWLLSVSGSSPNIVRAAEVAKQMGGYVVLFTGQKGTDLLKFVDAALVVEHVSSDVVQECHQFAYHLICDWVESTLA
ncbi:MAG: D-sedoheptulose-7-phosphate isomerase [Promethearchaeota archaeon]